MSLPPDLASNSSSTALTAPTTPPDTRPPRSPHTIAAVIPIALGIPASVCTLPVAHTTATTTASTPMPRAEQTSMRLRLGKLASSASGPETRERESVTRAR